MELIYGLLNSIKKILSSKGAISLKGFMKLSERCINYYKDQDEDTTELEDFVDFINEKYSITNSLVSFYHLVKMTSDYEKIKKSDIVIEKVDGMYINTETSIVFDKTDRGYVAIGKLDDGEIENLNLCDVMICSNNCWMWKFDKANETAKHISVSAFMVK